MLTRESKKTVSHPMRVPFLQLALVLCISLSTYESTWSRAEHISSLEALATAADEDLVLNYIDEFLRNPGSTAQLIERSLIYFPTIERALNQEGLPDDLRILPLIESRCNPLARSRVGAEGLWQFMIPTARQMGLRINHEIDERRDPLKATAAALSYLEYLYQKYEDWTLALAAYNAGPGRVNRAISHANGARDFSAIKQFLPRETRRYIPKYVALQYILENHRDHGILPRMPELDLHWIATVNVSKKIKLSEIAEITGISRETLAFLNPALKHDYVPDLAQGYDLILPQRVISIFEHYLLTEEKMPNPLTYRSVQMVVDRPQSIQSLASNLALDPYLLKSWNNLNGNEITIGQTIVVHELINPDREEQESNEPDVFKTHGILAPIPARFDLMRTFQSIYLDKLAEKMEEQNWDLHKSV